MTIYPDRLTSLLVPWYGTYTRNNRVVTSQSDKHKQILFMDWDKDHIDTQLYDPPLGFYVEADLAKFTRNGITVSQNLFEDDPHYKGRYSLHIVQTFWIVHDDPVNHPVLYTVGPLLKTRWTSTGFSGLSTYDEPSCPSLPLFYSNFI